MGTRLLRDRRACATRALNLARRSNHTSNSVWAVVAWAPTSDGAHVVHDFVVCVHLHAQREQQCHVNMACTTCLGWAWREPSMGPAVRCLCVSCAADRGGARRPQKAVPFCGVIGHGEKRTVVPEYRAVLYVRRVRCVCVASQLSHVPLSTVLRARFSRVSRHTHYIKWGCPPRPRHS